MFEVLKHGALESTEQFKELARQHRSLVLPSDEDADVTHWWVIRQEGVEILYVGSPESFAAYTGEHNGGIQ